MPRHSSVFTSYRHHVVAVFLWMLIMPTASAQRFAPQNAPAQEMPTSLKELADAFANGDAKGLMDHAAGRLDVTLFGTSELFSRSQAGYVLRAFFDEYAPERLDLTETSGTEGNWFAAGKYWYRRGEAPLSVYFRLRQGAGEWELREVRIGRIVDK